MLNWEPLDEVIGWDWSSAITGRTGLVAVAEEASRQVERAVHAPELLTGQGS